MIVPSLAKHDPSPQEIAQLANCVDLIGSASFAKEISELCKQLIGADMVFLSAFFDAHKPVALYASHTDAAYDAALNLYLDVAYLLDPFYQLFRNESGDQYALLDQIAPEQFRRSEYYQKFYKKIRLTKECGLLLWQSDEAALFLSMGSRKGGQKLRAARFQSFIPLIASIVRRHWTVLTPERPDGSGRLAAHLEAAFEAFGASILSPREGDIMRMILRGHSSKTIARAFDNSPETIKVHRKRAYSKLGIASQGELLSLFLSAMLQMPPNANGDPLQFITKDQARSK